MSNVTLEQARAAKESAMRVFEPLGQVVGLGITRVRGEYAIKVNLRALPAGGAALPSEIDGVPIRVEVVGTIRPR